MELMPILFFVATCIALMAGYPVALTLSGVAILFALLGMATGTFDSSVLTFTPNRLFGIISNQTLIAVPLFVFMGVMLEKSRVAENLLSTMARLFGPLPGGLGIARSEERRVGKECGCGGAGGR